MALQTVYDEDINTSVYSFHTHPLDDNMRTTHLKAVNTDSVTFHVYETVEEHIDRRRWHYDTGALRPIADIFNRKDATYTFRVEIDITQNDVLYAPVLSWAPLTQFDRSVSHGDNFAVTVTGLPQHCRVRGRIVRSPGVDTLRKVRILTSG